MTDKKDTPIGRGASPGDNPQRTCAPTPEAARKLAVKLSAHTGGATTIAVDTGHGRLDCELIEGDSIACRLDHLRLETSLLAGADMARLEKISHDLADRITYLLEAVGPIELDETSATVQMRSIPPHKEEAEIEYYELLVRSGGALLLRRYRQPAAAGQRRPIPATLTKEVVARLAADFLRAVQ